MPGIDDPSGDLLAPVGFADAEAARACLLRVAGDGTAGEVLADCLPMLLLALSETANPDHALLNFERFANSVPARLTLFRYLRDNPRAVEILVRLFVGSQFLTEIMIANPAYLERLTQHRHLSDLKSVQELHSEAVAAMAGATDVEQQLNALRRFQRWELLRIGTCDFFGLLDLRRVTVQLSLLAGSLVQACLRVAAESSEPSGIPAEGLAVIALGKLGGEELNYSSDIDLILVAESNSAAYWRIAQRMIRALTSATGDGFLYRVDMRLRPWGKAGELVSALDSHIAYLQSNAQLWEKQALLKARVVAGDAAVGSEFLRQARPLLFNTPQEVVRVNVSEMKQRIEDELHRKGRLWGEVKLGEGSIRDIEFIVQYLQLVNGKTQPDVLSFNTLDALVRLSDCGFLKPDEYRILTDGYTFLRTVEHSLQLMHNKQTHELPSDPGELSYLARRLDFASDKQFLDYYQQHCEAVRRVYGGYLGSGCLGGRHQGVGDGNAATEAEPPEPGVTRHVSRMERSYSQTFNGAAIKRHAALAEQINDQNLAVVEPVLRDNGDWQVTIVGYDYLGELSLICGLLLAHGFNIVDGQVFTYERTAGPPALVPPAPVLPAQRRGGRKRPQQKRPPADARLPAQPPPGQPGPTGDSRSKIVDVFTVRSAQGAVTAEVWTRYIDDLRRLLKQLHAGRHEEVQGAVAARVAAALRLRADASLDVLYPIAIEIDNMVSEHYTVLSIRSRDTIGFLYELTNALALNGVYIARVNIDTARDEACDTLYVTDAHGRKIVDPARQRELRAATVLIKRFTHLLPHSPNPESALLHFREFVAQLFTRPDWPDEIASLERSEVLDALARLLGVSDFLWNDFLRMQHANLFPVVRDVDALAAGKSKAELAEALEACLARGGDDEARREELNAFKDRETFRVDMRHILGHISDFSMFSGELTDVAEVVIEAACRLCETALRAPYGAPQREGGATAPFSVCALGKCGGRELGFASDIELMFIYCGEGRTAGPQSIPVSEFFVKLVEGVTHAIRARREGIFEIDLRLRPYGRAGSLAVSLEAFGNYFGPNGPAWPFERQALVKLRPITGDRALGEQIVRLRDEMIYTREPFDVVAMRAMRERQVRQLVTPGTFNAKLSPGGLVDVEYLVQGLQITHGRRLPAARATNTLEAMSALAEAGIFSAADHQRLHEAYNFLRSLIGALRVVRGNARDLTIPAGNTEEFAFLARRMGYDLTYENDISRLPSDLSRHTANVQELGQILLG